jgi:hypothetical protein
MAVRMTAAMKKLRSHRKKAWLGGVPPLGPPRIVNITTPAKQATKLKTKKNLPNVQCSKTVDQSSNTVTSFPYHLSPPTRA